MYNLCMLSMQRSQRKKWADPSRNDDQTHVDVGANLGIHYSSTETTDIGNNESANASLIIFIVSYRIISYHIIIVEQ